ncbi:RHS repeat-associated core domain-containing protein [Sorangium sp. So ce136]|uniref:RHS repeat domain-containing protein n=1 Tax=Sorangium sp. So ce136 TaxID=3133284 RepID=UPI003F0C9C64
MECHVLGKVKRREAGCRRGRADVHAEWRGGMAVGSRDPGEDNRLVSVSENRQALSRALYDGSGERRVHLHGVAGEEETAYVDQHLVVRNGVVATKHLFAGETRIASKIDADWFQEPPVLYYHPDHLGSTQYVTDQDQQLSQHVEYLPSGELWADQTDSRFQNRQPYLFTGKELDLSTGLYYYGARSYEPRLGVWLSPDPILDQYMRGAPNGGVYDPIHLGLYAYTRNNPLRFVDPTGLAEECVDGGCQSFVGRLDSPEQSIDPEDTMCGSGVCVDGGPVERDALRHVENDLPLEAPVIDPIDLVGIGSAGYSFAKIGIKALRGTVARKLATKAAAGGEGGLVHFTSEAGEAGIKSSGELIGKHGVFALPESAASRSPITHAMLTGLSPAKTARIVQIPGPAVGSFQRVIPIGIYSAMKAAGGVRFTAPGTINMFTGAFKQTGSVLVPYAAVYGPDLLIYGAAAASCVAISGMDD